MEAAAREAGRRGVAHTVGAATASHVGGFAPKPPADGAPTPSAVESTARCRAIAG